MANLLTVRNTVLILLPIFEVVLVFSVENAETIGTRMFPVSFQLILSGEISRTRKSSGANPEKRSPSRFQFPISDPFLSFFAGKETEVIKCPCESKFVRLFLLQP